MSASLTLRDRTLGVLRNRCTCLMPGERSDVADDLCRAAEIDRAALKAERDRYREALEQIDNMEHALDMWKIARIALDSDPDLAERTRRIRADE